jgi:hypothetical protein
MTTEYVSTDKGSLGDVLVVIETREYAQEGDGKYLGKQIRYWCVGCNCAHQIAVRPWAGDGASWQWNGKVDHTVTLSPSQLCRSYRYPANGTDADKAEFDALRDKAQQQKNSFDVMCSSRFRHTCHTFVGVNGAPPGHIIFLNDCFADGKPFPVNGQVHKLLPRRDWPEEHGYWSRRAVKGAPNDPE